MSKILLYPTVYGAYTELYAGLSPELTMKEHQGSFIIPWGRKGSVRPDIEAEANKADGGQAAKLFAWADRVTSKYA